MQANIDVVAFNKAYRDALPDKFEKAKAKNVDAQAVGLFGVEKITETLEDVRDDVCSAWPQIKPWLAIGLAPLRYWKPALAAKGQAFLDAMDKEVMPKICTAAKQT